VPALHSTWPSLSSETFPERFRRALEEQEARPAPEPRPAPKPIPAPAPQPPAPSPKPAPPEPTPVHPGWGTAGASGIALAAVTVIVWLLSLQGLAVPGPVQDASVTLLTAASGFFVHTFMRPKR
jgi:hypothetical protein